MGYEIKQIYINIKKIEDGEKWVEIIYNCPGKRVEPIRPKYKNCHLLADEQLHLMYKLGYEIPPRS